MDSPLVTQAVARAKAGDASALDFLYVRYADEVCAYVQGIVHDQREAEDITRSLFATLSIRIGRYERRRTPFSAWILRVARDAALDHVHEHDAPPVLQSA